MNRLDPATGENRNWIAIRNSRVRLHAYIGSGVTFRSDVPQPPGARCAASRPCEPRSTGRMRCSPTLNATSSAGSVSSRVASICRAAQAVGAATAVEQYQVMDQLSLLVDKSLVVAEDISGAMRYRLLETVRQYALEKLGESGEADAVRDRHGDHYTDRAADLASLVRCGDERLMDWARRDRQSSGSVRVESRKHRRGRRCGSRPRRNCARARFRHAGEEGDADVESRDRRARWRGAGGDAGRDLPGGLACHRHGPGG